MTFFLNLAVISKVFALTLKESGVNILWHLRIGSCGGIGRRNGLKIRRSKIRTGSSPVTSTIYSGECAHLNIAE